MNVLRSHARAAALAAAVAALTLLAAPALAGAHGNDEFNFNAILRPVAGGTDHGFGVVKFRQPEDEDKIVSLDVRVWRLAPNHSYYVQRRTDSMVDDCTGTNWLILGQGLGPEAIATDEKGRGRADLFRDLAAIPVGMQFDIQFQVIDAVTSAVVLESRCYQFTVRQ